LALLGGCPSVHDDFPNKSCKLTDDCFAGEACKLDDGGAGTCVAAPGGAQ
jgi:hypothetical protein